MRPSLMQSEVSIMPPSALWGENTAFTELAKIGGGGSTRTVKLLIQMNKGFLDLQNKTKLVTANIVMQGKFLSAKAPF